MRKRFILFLLPVLALSALFPALALVERHPELDAAFSMIEEGNLFLERYNQLTGANVQATYKYGLPYFFGGKNTDYLMKIKRPIETTKYYRTNQTYVYGFDCSGFTNWINEQSGKPRHDTLQAMILQYVKYKDNHLPIKDVPFDRLHEKLRVGDFLVGKHSARHIMMYIGTLEDYGFTAETAPEAKDFLTYPLVIHDGANPFYPERYERYIEENNLKAPTTNGGVCVSIIGVPASEMPQSVESNRLTFHYFNLQDYQLTLYDVTTATSYVWFRM